jgi:hypothetical protein
MTKSNANTKAQAPPPSTPEVSPVVLRNKGVPVVFLRLVNGQPAPEDDWVNGEQPTQQVHLRFDANAVAEIEDAFEPFVCMVEETEERPILGEDGKPLVGPKGPVVETIVTGREERVFYGVQAFQKSLETKVVKTIRKTFSIALGIPETEAGRMMIPSQMPEYQNAIGVAWSICQGVDPIDAARVLAKSTALVAARRAEMSAEMESELTKMTEADSGETNDSPGPTGPPPGSPTD